MRVTLRSLLACLTLGVCIAALDAGSYVALADTSAALQGTILGGPLLPPTTEALTGTNLAAVSRRLRWVSPQAYAARTASQTSFRSLGSAAALQLDTRTFAAAIGRPASAPIAGPQGASLERFVTDHSAALTLPGGRRALLESTTPIAAEPTHGHRVPLDLALRHAGRGFEPVAAAAPVEIPSELADGIRLPAIGVTLTALSEGGTPLHATAGDEQHTDVLYANSQTSVDTAVSATPSGAEISEILRSAASPSRLRLGVSLPAGGKLREQRPGGPIVIVEDGHPVGAIVPPTATDAAGERVSVSMSLAGQTITIAVDEPASDIQYPLDVDPEVIDEQVTGNTAPTRWKFGPSGAPHFQATGWGETLNPLYLESIGTYKGGEYGYLTYQTQGESHIFWGEIETKVQNPGNIETILQLVHRNESTGAEEAEQTKILALPHEEIFEKSSRSVCAEHPVHPECPIGGSWWEYGAPHNQFKLQDSATAEGTGWNHANIYSANVWIYQAKGPEVSFNKSAETLPNGRHNVLYGSGSWLGPFSGAFEARATDPGVGISSFRLWPASLGVNHEYLKEKLCEGIQCYPEIDEPITYNPALADGEDKVEIEAHDAALGTQAGTPSATIKVDSTPPHAIKISGIAETGGEMSEAPHVITAEATDGTSPTPSSGIKALSIAVDGKEIGSPAGSCTPGPCTATAKFTVSGENYGAGVHSLRVTATDNAGNVAPVQEYFFAVRGSQPVSVGPAAVDPTTGQLTLTATDISLTGVGGLTRTYKSRETQGIEGPLGSQWATSLGTDVALALLPDGSAALTNGSAGLTTFQPSEGGFTSPPGDSNLKLEPVTNKKTGQPEYVLRNTNGGSAVHFAQPEGIEQTPPTYGAQFGAWGSGIGQFFGPTGVAAESSGDVLVADKGNSRVEKFSPTGTYLSTFEAGHVTQPWGIAVNPTTHNVYVTSETTDQIVEFSSSGTFLHAYGTVGSGEVQFNAPKGIAIDSAGNVYVVDGGNYRVEEISEAGKFIEAFGSKGTGSGQFTEPSGIALANGKVYVTDPAGEKVDVFSTAGAFKEAFATPASSLPVGITADHAGDLYITYAGATTVHEFSPTFTALNTFGEAGSGPGQLLYPFAIAFGPTGTMYVDDEGGNRMELWVRSAWMPVAAEGPATTDATTFNYRAIVNAEGKTEIQPTLELGPAPASTTCSPTPEKGCRLLKFVYGSSTTATGESQSQWGEYKNRLKEVVFDAWNPETKAMQETAVAAYSWDNHGLLRAEWDPRISPTLKTTYGYDSEHYLTSVAPPGEEPWLFHYGMLAGDSGRGRVLSVIRPNASVALGGTEPPTNTAVPTLSSTKPVVGTKISVSSNGTWTHSPLIYDYQWEDCNSTGKECVAIPGAVNQSYYPATSDQGHTLVAQVSALNANAAVVASTVATSAVATGTPNNPAPEPPVAGSNEIWTIDYRVPVSGTGAPHEMTAAKVAEWGQKAAPAEATAFFDPVEPMGWPAKDYTRAQVDYLDSVGRSVNKANPASGVSTVEFNSFSEVTRTLSAVNRETALKAGSKSVEVSKLLDTQTTYGDEGNRAEMELGPQHPVRLANGTETSVRTVTHLYYNEGAPEEAQYSLVTKTITAAILESGEEVEKRETVNGYGAQGDRGWELRKPTTITTEPKGINLTEATRFDERGNMIEASSPASQQKPWYHEAIGSAGSKEGQFELPNNVTLGNKGELWITDTSGKYGVDVLGAHGEFIRRFGTEGEGPGELESPSGIAISPSGKAYVADSGNNRISVYSESGTYQSSFGSKGSGEGQFADPEGVAYDTHNNEVYVADTHNHRIAIYTAEGKFVSEFGTKGTGEYQFNTPRGIAVAPNGNIYVADTLNNRVVIYTAEGKYVGQFGAKGSGEGQFKEPIGISIDSDGTVYVIDSGNHRVQQFSTTNGFLTSFGSEGEKEGQFENMGGIAVSPSGIAYVTNWAAHSAEIAEWKVAAAVNGARTEQEYYYTADASSPVSTCRNHPEWAGLLCQQQPAAQPETAGVPSLPVSVATYNYYDAIATVTETYGSIIRTKTIGYDAAGRELTSEVTSTADMATPKVTLEYSASKGMVKKKSTKVGETTVSDTETFNNLGLLESYTDANGNTTNYKFNVDNQPTEVSDAKGSQKYTYEASTGYMTGLVDSAAGSFSATFNVEGQMLSQSYPNGMIERAGYSATGQQTNVEYEKTSHCSCILYKDSIVPGTHGETLHQATTFAIDNYRDDPDGRLVEAQETPTGEKCLTRQYEYDAESNRLWTITHEPGEGGVCSTLTGGLGSESHTYDPANRLTDAGVEYDPFSDITTLPAADAGGNALKSAFYVDGQVYTQEQSGVILTNTYDPLGRARETTASGKSSGTQIFHYADGGTGVTWIGEGGEAWTRNIPGLDGGLDATQKNGASPVIQIHDLSGDVVGTASISETETKLLTTDKTTEFGVPLSGAAPHYGWLGAADVPTELSSGSFDKGGMSFVPQLAKTLQYIQAVPPGAMPSGSGPGAPYTTGLSAESLALGEMLGVGAPAREAERERQKAREAEEALIAAIAAGAEDPTRKYFLLAPPVAKELAESLKSLSTKAQLIGLILSAVPALGEAASLAGETYGAYLEFWAQQFDHIAELMEKEWNSTKRYPDVYLVTEWYFQIKLIGDFPETYHYEQCTFVGWTTWGNTRYACPTGIYQTPGRHY